MKPNQTLAGNTRTGDIREFFFFKEFIVEITLNQKQRLFVFKGTEYTSCLGYDVVFNYCCELVSRINKFDLLKAGQTLAPVLESEIGMLAQYQQYKALLAILGTRKTGTWFNFETPTKVRTILDRYRNEGGQLRIFYGDRKTGRCWMEENDVLGRVGRSTGTMQIPILIEEGECGGAGILDSSIVRIIDADTREELYRQKNYHLPEMELRHVDTALATQGYTHGAWVQNREGEFSNHANFKSYGKAAQWVAFMTGDCTEQPA